MFKSFLVNKKFIFHTGNKIFFKFENQRVLAFVTIILPLFHFCICKKWQKTKG
jgi:hypothetical protein